MFGRATTTLGIGPHSSYRYTKFGLNRRSSFDMQFLAKVNYRSSSLFAIARPSSVCCLSSVTFVRPTQAVQIFGNISTVFGTLAIH